MPRVAEVTGSEKSPPGGDTAPTTLSQSDEITAGAAAKVDDRDSCDEAAGSVASYRKGRSHLQALIVEEQLFVQNSELVSGTSPLRANGVGGAGALAVAVALQLFQDAPSGLVTQLARAFEQLSAARGGGEKTQYLWRERGVRRRC